MRPGRFLRALPAILAAAALSGCGVDGSVFRTVARTGPKTACFLFHQGTFWVGTGEGLIRVQPDGSGKRTFGEDAGLKGRQLNIMGVTPYKDKLLLATSAGLFKFDPSKGRITGVWTTRDGLGNDCIREVFSRDGRLWAATIFGASLYDPASGRWTNYGKEKGLPKQHVYSFAYDKGTLWASSMNGGLVRFLPARDRFSAIPSEKGIGNSHIYDIEPSPDGLWLGTAAGVNFYSTREGKWIESICSDGFTDYTVYSLKLAGDNLWFATSFGLYRRNLVDGRQKVYTCANGLPSMEITALEVVDGTLWVCTREGLARFKGNPGK